MVAVERPGTLRPVEVLGAAWLDAVRRALVRESFTDMDAVVTRVTEAVETEMYGAEVWTSWEALATEDFEEIGW